MNGIIGLSQLALKTSLTPEQQDFIEKILDSSEMLMGLVNDLLDYSQLEFGEFYVERELFNLEKVLNTAMTICSLKNHDTNVEFDIDIAPKVPLSLIGDHIRLQQVLVYFSKYIACASLSTLIKIAIQPSSDAPEDNRLKLIYTITGVAPNISSSKHQEDPTCTQGAINLTMAKRVLTAMGGEILSDKNPCSISFAITEEMAPEQALPDSKLLADISILVVDDNDIALSLMCKMLSDKGAIVTAAKSGKEALKSLSGSKTNPPDLVILDWQMPDLNGIETTKQILELDDLDAKPKIMMVTAYTDDHLKQQANKIGIDCFIEKPVSAYTLVQAVKNCIADENATPDVHNGYTDIGYVDLSGASILLVEDNRINRQVTSGFLKDTGVTIDIAENGEIALERVKQNNYDLILMDIQMPVKDGLQTTTEIRALDDRKDVPIIAMTAHAMASMRERSREVGMNDFISKPVSADELIRKVYLWLDLEQITKRKSNKVISTQMLGSEENREIMAALNRDTPLQVDAALRNMHGKTSLYLNLLKDFVKDHKHIGETLKGLLLNKQLDDINRYAHSLKSNASYIGASMVSSAAAELEQASSRNRDVETKIYVVVELTTAVILPIEKCLAQFSSTDVHFQAFDVQTAKGIINRLVPLVESLDARAEDLVPALIQVCQHSEFNELANGIAELLEDIEYDAAHHALKLLEERLG